MAAITATICAILIIPVCLMIVFLIGVWKETAKDIRDYYQRNR